MLTGVSKKISFKLRGMRFPKEKYQKSQSLPRLHFRNGIIREDACQLLVLLIDNNCIGQNEIQMIEIIRI
jgi:hypothetical protein